MVLISISTLDFSYVVEENISFIFDQLHRYKMRVGVIQNSAISFFVCFENNYNHLDELLLQLKSRFKVLCDDGVSLYTIRHYNQRALKEIERGKHILLKQILGDTVQLVVK